MPTVDDPSPAPYPMSPLPGPSDLLDLPLFDAGHRRLADGLAAWRDAQGEAPGEADVDATCRRLVADLGAAGWLRHCVPAPWGGEAPRLEVRALCIAREILAAWSGLADFAFAMQGLGAGPITLFGTQEQRHRCLPAVAQGRWIGAFALSERASGSDVAAIDTRAVRDGEHWVLDGEKTWISNAGIADFYVIFARSGESAGARGLSAFLVEADTPGLRVSERIEVNAPHPLGTVELEGCRVPADHLIGRPGEGFKVAMATLDRFRPTVGAAALGFARRALAETLAHVRARRVFGQRLADLQGTQFRLADMATRIDAAGLLVHRAAWLADAGGRERITREASMAKLHATEAAQVVVDDAVQLLGGRGVVRGETVERLYREVRALRIYEGASEIQKLVIAGQMLR
jgi:acyl-CoA dehydrogenase